MKVVDLKNELEKLEAEGKIKDQNVEVITLSQKYFISEVDITTELVTLNITRKQFLAKSPRGLLSTLKNASLGAELSIYNLDKGQNINLSGVYASQYAIELTAES